ncbi:MAG: FUN14 domain-containing protein [Thermoproteota archaeon]|nr:FUN14 domain-containing protein [Thermoproteota archaeon]
MPFVSTIGGGFLAGALLGYALKKAMKIVVVILGLFIAALSYLEYQRIVLVDWLQTISQNAITWLANALAHISNNIGANHGVPTNLGTSNVIPLASRPHVRNGARLMNLNFQKLFGPITKSREDKFFDDIIGGDVLWPPTPFLGKRNKI